MAISITQNIGTGAASANPQQVHQTAQRETHATPNQNQVFQASQAAAEKDSTSLKTGKARTPSVEKRVESPFAEEEARNSDESGKTKKAKKKSPQQQESKLDVVA